MENGEWQRMEALEEIRELEVEEMEADRKMRAKVIAIVR